MGETGGGEEGGRSRGGTKGPDEQRLAETALFLPGSVFSRRATKWVHFLGFPLPRSHL